MFILMISIAILLLVVSIWILSCVRRDPRTYTKKISRDMHITFLGTGSTEPIPILSDELRHYLRSRNTARGSNFPSHDLICPAPSRNTGTGNGKSSV